MALIVQKFGGTSVKDTERLKAVADHVGKTCKEGHKVVVVVSAPAGMTDDLTRRAFEVNENPSAREMDMLLSTGEQISISLLAMALQNIGYDAVSLTGAQMHIMTDGEHQQARILSIDQQRVCQELDNGKVVIVAGFQGLTHNQEITTLGRGGSDTTAVAIAAAIHADLCEIYTDVDGIYTADPRVVSNPAKLNKISFDEMLELASLGAKVLHPRAVELAKMHKVPLCVRSSYHTDVKGSYVVDSKLIEQEYVVTGLALDKNIAKIGIIGVQDKPGIAAHIFQALADEKINVDMIIQSAMYEQLNDIAFTVPKTQAKKAVHIINELRDEISYENVVFADDVVKLSVVGAGMVSAHGIAATMFKALFDKGINIDMISTSEIKISCVIQDDEQMVKVAMQTLHDVFELDQLK